MDKYEKEFREKMKKSAREMAVDRAELAQLRLKSFAVLLFSLIKEKGESFDLLVGGGNSGLAMIEITKMVYRKAAVEIPPVFLLPVFRPSNHEDIKIDEDLIIEQLKNIKSIKRILFVDDEIMLAQNAKICFETIRDFLADESVPCLSCTIVAENHFFVWQYDLPGIAVRFLPFAMVLQGYNGNFGYLIPEKVINKLEPVLGDGAIDRNQALALLLAGKRKILENKTATFDLEIEKKLASKIQNYGKLKQEFIKKIEILVEEAIIC